MTRSSQSRQPFWQITETDGQHEIKLCGSWTLLAVTRAGHGLSRGLRDLAGQSGDPVWNVEHVDALDSAGALALWRAWGLREPGRLRVRDDQRPLFEHLRKIDINAKPPQLGLLSPLVNLGQSLVSLLSELGGILLLLGQITVDWLYCFRNPRALPLRAVSATIYRAGAQSMALLAFVGVVVGVVLTYQIGDELRHFGQSTQVVSAVGLAFLRELGPFVAGIIVVGRSGSSFTAGIGAMRMTGEIDALEALGASPTLRLVFPKVMGLAIAMPLLVVWTDFCGIVGAILVSTPQLNIGYQMWFNMFPTAVPWGDFVIGFGKGILFGAMIGLVASYYGLRAKPNTQSLTDNTIRSVVFNLTLVLTIDGLLGLSLTGVGLG